MAHKFKLSEKEVKEVYGDKFDEKMASWQEGQDYVIRKCFKSFKRVYREDLLASLEVKVGLAEDVVQVDVSPAKMTVSDDTIFTETVENIFPNTRYVRVKSGKTIFVGGKGLILKRGQRISYKGTTLFLGKAQS
ncbi:hypothetical protein UFOVP742_14 [uncultured Caudovirales phage]|uniref:Uncharacterized protein n=1 Tax=uncultured Caudovirales phage TaxID=2100421 RepID=A0A6J7X2A7_9CAUD|nr:hypothetical protein UFOVP742_14 [uncultured Caudovirales phage]